MTPLNHLLKTSIDRKYCGKAKKSSFCTIILEIFDETFDLVVDFDKYLRYNLLTIVAANRKMYSRILKPNKNQ